MQNKKIENEFINILKKYGLKWVPYGANSLSTVMENLQSFRTGPVDRDYKIIFFRHVAQYDGRIVVENGKNYAKKMGIKLEDAILLKELNEIMVLVDRVGTNGFGLGYTFSNHSVVEETIRRRIKSKPKIYAEHKKEYKIMSLFDKQEAEKKMIKKLIKRLVDIKRFLYECDKLKNLGKEIENFIEKHYEEKGA